eukprot:2740786-Pleurochrysis_carterae.AAC.2
MRAVDCSGGQFRRNKHVACATHTRDVSGVVGPPAIVRLRVVADELMRAFDLRESGCDGAH